MINMDCILNVAAFIKNSLVVGPGIRDALWVQGCSILCPGCFNQAFLPHVERRLIPVREFLKHFQNRVGQIDGISVLGGEPTEQAEGVAELLEGVKTLGLSTVVFTGRIYEELQKTNDFFINRLLGATDLLIDGPYMAHERGPHLYWRGSRNQRLLYLTSRLQAQISSNERPMSEVLISESVIVVNGVVQPRF